MPLDDALRRFLDGWEEVQVGKDGALSLPPSAEQDLSPSADPKTAEMVAEMLARVLRERFGGMSRLRVAGRDLDVQHGPLHRSIQYNQEPFNLLGQSQEYRIDTGDGTIDVSLQLYENVANHFRLFAFVGPTGKAKGLLFSVNLDVGITRGSGLTVQLSQVLNLSQRGPAGVDTDVYAAYRHERQALMVRTLADLGYVIDHDRRVYIGAFEPDSSQFRDVNGGSLGPDEFIGRFLEIAIVAGHFRENKGYQLSWLPAAKSW